MDEGSPSLSIAYKRLFQGKSGMVDLGRSATNMHAYKTTTWGVRIIVACNDWAEKVSALPCVDQDWLSSNAIVVQVHEPLWL